MGDRSFPFSVLIYDGECVFCSKTVRLLLKADTKKIIRFAPANAEFVKQNFPGLNTASVIFIHHDKIYQKSSAVFEACRQAGGWVYPLSLLSFLPAKWCDVLYDFVARHRYKWLGRSATCVLPAAYPGRFLA